MMLKSLLIVSVFRVCDPIMTVLRQGALMPHGLYFNKDRSAVGTDDRLGRSMALKLP